MKFGIRREMWLWQVFLFVILLLSSAEGHSNEGVRHTSSGEHYFRHQQHYNQRIEQAVNDFKTAHWHRDRNASHLVQLRHRHLEPPQPQPIEEEPVPVVHSTSGPFVGRHHLRHYNRHHQTWEQRVFPALRHQMTTTTATTESPPHPAAVVMQIKRKLHSRRERFNVTETRQGRVFDRDGLYKKTTKVRHGFALKQSEDSPVMNHYKDADRNLIERMQVGRKRAEEEQNDEEDDDDDDDDYYEDDDDDNGDEDNFDDDEDDLDAADDEDEGEGRGDDAFDGDTENVGDDEMDANANRIDNDKISSKLQKSNSLDQTTDVYSKTAAYIPGPFTRHKYETLGTHEAVKQSRKSHITNQQHHRALANAHATKVHIEATCRWPKPKVEKIQKDPSKLYVPHCTILHRCGDDTGCCSTDLKTCIAKRTQAVDLYFFVKALGTKHGTIERLTFINHTECQCVDKSKYPTYIHSAPEFLRRATILDCNCPKPFEKVLQDNGICRCDCSSGNTGCDWLKRGMEHFSMADRKCISEGRCKHPTCEYGNYAKDHGRCPKKENRTFH